MIGFFKTISLIRKLDKGQIKFTDLPFDKMREIDVVRIIRHHCIYFQQLPAHFKTERVIYTVIMEKDSGIRLLGLDVVKEIYVKDAITRWGRRAFLALNDISKTDAVCMHGIARDPKIFQDIKVEDRTQAMSNLAFLGDAHNFSHIKNEHVTPEMVKAIFEKKLAFLVNYRLDGLITRDIAEYIIKERPEFISSVPEQHMTAEAMALCFAKDPEMLGYYKDIKKSLEAMTIAVKHHASLQSRIVDLEMEGGCDLLGFMAKYRDEQKEIHEDDRAIFHCMLHQIDALNPEKLASLAKDDPALIELMQMIHGSDTTLKFFPKAPGRGEWLMGELGL
jgi:hypothetical protein